MARIRTTMQFQVEQLWLRPEALGEAIEFERDGWLVRVEFPRDPDDWYLKQGDKKRFPAGPLAGPRTGGEVIPIVALRVSVTRDAPFGADVVDRAASDALTEHDDEAEAMAQAVVAELVGWTRIQKGQPWLGMSHSSPERVGGRYTFDVDANEPIIYATGQIIMVDRKPELAIDVADFQALAPFLGDNRPEMPLGDVLIADGRHLLTLGKPNPSQAVLLAAIGSEVKVKATLRANADATQGLLVDYILGNPRDVTVQAANLFDQVMFLVAGRSLKADNKPVFKALQKLFELRNAVAHRGKVVSVDDAGPAVSAAVDAAKWLDSL